MKLKEYRNACNFTQKEAAVFLGVSDKTYFRYENEDKYEGSLKYMKMCELLADKGKIDETHGILTLAQIKESLVSVFQKYDVSFAYLFGSYAKGKASEKSDVDILVGTSISGLSYYGLLQDAIDSLHKNVDLIRLKDTLENEDFLNEILKDGIKIYG